ncbi:SNARE associated Golgi protein [uncultured Clostridium sp.]|uniref:DedA family protein n=1 Tax=uncultured Clostridium sp. TaxID=59620 RepID=UPI000822CEC3|nr:DedA family protein [uncultured Clostridium sp.]SCJ93396.1 SNARE associated Golgi protein [uncultured Clostridium sp.]
MDVNGVISYLSHYGMIFLFIVILLEYLNLPGFPAGIILPVAGIWVANSNHSFITALIISVLAGLIGSCVLYGLGLFGGEFLLKKYVNKFPKQGKYIEEKIEFLRSKGNVGVFVSKLIPMVRTLISIPAGVIRLNFLEYSLYSALGILIWNGAFMSAGYLFGDIVLKNLM